MTMFKEIEQVKKEIQEHATIGWCHLVKDTDHFDIGVAYS